MKDENQNTEKTAVPEETPEAPLEFNRVNSLEDLAGCLSSTFEIHLVHRNRPFAIEARTMSPAEDAKLREMRATAVPPVINGATPDEDRVDLYNNDFIQKRDHLNLVTRAMAIYWCVPLISKGKPGLVNGAQITEYVQGIPYLTDTLLQAIYEGISTYENLTLAKAVDFTSASPSQPS